MRFILQNERNSDLYFSPIGSQIYNQLVSQSLIPTEIDSIIFYDGHTFLFHSDAVIAISDYLKFPYCQIKEIYKIPKPFRDFVYKFIAKIRYSIFGRKDVCDIIYDIDKNRFI